MPELRVDGRSGSYPVVVEPGSAGRAAALARELAGASKVLVVCDHNTADIAGNRIAVEAGAEVLELEPGEGTKSFAALEAASTAAARAGLDRGSVVVAVGGGVIGDLAGTLAAVYLRGIRLIHVPTTLLAMVDSSIGGKAAVNLPAGKNLVGAFKSPEAVFIDPDLLPGLPEREFRSGMAEVIKSGLIADSELVRILDEEGNRVRTRDRAALLEVVNRTCAVKVGVVTRDADERGERAILNYGHTFAHALEAASGYSPGLTHGEAVSAGMEVAAEVGRRSGVTPEAVLPVQSGLIAAYGLPRRSPVRVDADRVITAMSHDKKTQAGQVRWVLLDQVGKASWGHAVEPRVVREVVAQALTSR